MKNKEFDKIEELFNFLQDNNLDFSYDKEKLLGDYLEKNTLKINKKAQKDENKIERKKSQKYNKNKEIFLENQLKDDNFAKNIINTRNKYKKKSQKIEEKNQKRIERCNNQLLMENLDNRDILLTIDKYNTNGKQTVVYFIDSYLPVIDGVVAVLENYAIQMQKYYNVVVCAPKHRNKSYKTDKYLVLSADSVFVKKQGYDLGFPQFDPFFQNYLSMLKIDLIHIQSPFNMGNFGLSLAKRRKIPCLATFHSQFKQNFYNAIKSDTISTWLTKILMVNYQKATVAVTMNSFASNIMKEYGLKKKVEIVPNATNLKRKEFDEEYENYILKKHGINKNKFNMIFIGRFVEVKNVYFILEVLVELFKTEKDFNFIFLGYGPEQSKMQKIVKENNMQDIVKFTGKIDDADEKAIIIKNSNLLLFPSVYDTDGIVKIECACYDVPAFCIKETGAASNIVDNHNGFIEDYDKDKFVEKLKYLVKNVDFVKNVGINANKELYITWEDVCEILNKLYQKTLKSDKFKNS